MGASMASTFVWLFWVFDSVFCHVLGLVAFRRGCETRGAASDRALSCVCCRAIRLPWRDVRGLGLVRGVLLPVSNRDVLEERVLALGEPLVVHVHRHLSVSVGGVSDEGCDTRARVRESRRAHRKVFRSRVRPSRVLSSFVLLPARRRRRCSLGGRKK